MHDNFLTVSEFWYTTTATIRIRRPPLINHSGVAPASHYDAAENVTRTCAGVNMAALPTSPIPLAK